MNELQIKNLSVSYRNTENAASNKSCILEDFSLTVRSKELVVVLGPSGCGKSTLLTAISGLKEPDKGQISFGETCFFNQQDQINIPAEQRNIGFVFQSYALWPHMTIAQNIAFPLQIRKANKKQIQSRVAEMLKIVHMSGYEDRYPGSLSGGEKQRIALARSLVYQPSLLLLDEPLANLDAHLKVSLIREIKDIQRSLGVTAIYVTHDQNEAFEIADRIVIMNEGKIMQQGSPWEVYHQSANLFVADFIGKNNIFETSCKAFPRFLGKCGAKRAVTIRPEDIEVNGCGSHRGVIEQISFKGDRVEYAIASGGVTFLAYSSNNELYSVGDDVYFEINRCHTF